MRRVILDQKALDTLLGRKPLTFVTQQMSDNGYHITYKNFYNLYHNKSNWTLTNAWCLAEVFGVPIEQLFHVKSL